MSYYFDSHCHLDDERFKEDLPEIIQKMKSANVKYCLSLGTDVRSSKENISIAETYDMVYAACGVHPHQAQEVEESFLSDIETLLSHPKVKALGEIGLDYYYDFSPREKQKMVLRSQIELAYQKKTPIVLHVREAHGDMIDTLKTLKNKLPGGVIHSFSGSKESAKIYLDMGFYISFTGAVTFKNASKLLEVAKFVPLDRLLIETDSPYLAPVPYRGKRNDPSYVFLVCEKQAELHGVSSEKMAEISSVNARMLFGICE